MKPWERQKIERSHERVEREALVPVLASPGDHLAEELEVAGVPLTVGWVRERDPVTREMICTPQLYAPCWVLALGVVSVEEGERYRTLDKLMRHADWRTALEGAFRVGGKRMLFDVMQGLMAEVEASKNGGGDDES